MTDEPTKVSTEDEAHEIFLAARLGIGPTSTHGHVVRNCELEGTPADPSGQPEDELPHKDNGLATLPHDSGLTDDRDSKDSTRAVGEPSTSASAELSVDPEELNAHQTAAASSLLKESPRQAFLNLQQSFAEARRDGFFK